MLSNPPYKQYKWHSVLPNRDATPEDSGWSNIKLTRIMHYNVLNPWNPNRPNFKPGDLPSLEGNKLPETSFRL